MLERKPWKPERVVWLLMGWIACNMLGTLVVQGYTGALDKEGPKTEPSVFVMLAGTFTYQVSTLVMLGVFLQQHRISWSDAFGFKMRRLARTLGLAVLAAAIVLPITMSLGGLSKAALNKIGSSAEIQESVKMLQTVTTFEQQVYFAIVIVFLAPFVEEIIFRGILYPMIKQSGFPRFALWSTSFFFALSHFNKVAFVPLLFMAVILTFLYETTENLLAPIVTHALFNATNFALLLLKPDAVT